MVFEGHGDKVLPKLFFIKILFPMLLFKSSLFEIDLPVEFKSLNIQSNSLAIPNYYSQSQATGQSSQDLHYNIK